MTLSTQGTTFETADGGVNWYDIAAGGPQTPTTTLPNGLIFEAVTSGTNQSNVDPFFSNNSANGTQWNETGTYNATTNPYAQQATNYYSSSSMNETAVWGLTFTNYNSENEIFADNTDVTWELSTNGGADWGTPSSTGNGMSNPPANTVYQSVWVPSAGSNGMMYAVTSARHNLYQSDFTDDGSS